MVSPYTDESREARYDMLRGKAERCDKLFGNCLKFSIVIGLCESACSLFSGPMGSVLSAGMVKLQSGGNSLISIAVMAFACIAIASRSWKLVIAALAAVIIAGVAGCFCMLQIGLIDIIFLSLAARASFTYANLREEEGFPRFRIDFEETEARTASQVRYIKKRALESGVREAQETLDPNAEMADLLDAGSDKQFLNAELSNYHDRFHGADAVVHEPELHDDSMEEL